MGFRFRRSIRIAPGVRVNVGKKSTSLSVGPRGATMNVGKKGTRVTVGLPGTGLSYSTMVSKAKARPKKPEMKPERASRQFDQPWIWRVFEKPTPSSWFYIVLLMGAIGVAIFL